MGIIPRSLQITGGREPYGQKRPLRGSVTEGEKCKLLETGDALKLHVETCYVS